MVFYFILIPDLKQKFDLKATVTNKFDNDISIGIKRNRLVFMSPFKICSLNVPLINHSFYLMFLPRIETEVWSWCTKRPKRKLHYNSRLKSSFKYFMQKQNSIIILPLFWCALRWLWPMGQCRVVIMFVRSHFKWSKIFRPSIGTALWQYPGTNSWSEWVTKLCKLHIMKNILPLIPNMLYEAMFVVFYLFGFLSLFPVCLICSGWNRNKMKPLPLVEAIFFEFSARLIYFWTKSVGYILKYLVFFRSIWLWMCIFLFF